MNWLQIPWTPLVLIGTAVAFVIGFQNNAAYARIWEARKILAKPDVPHCGHYAAGGQFPVGAQRVGV